MQRRPWLNIGYDSLVHIERIKKNTKNINLEFRFTVLVYVIITKRICYVNTVFRMYAYLSRECEIRVRMKLIVLPPMTGDWVSVSGTGDEPGRERQAAGDP